MAIILRVKENVCGTSVDVENNVFDDTVRYLNTYLESNGKMSLEEYKLIVNRKMKFNIPYDSVYDSAFGFIPSEKHETFYSTVSTWFDDKGNVTEYTGELLYRSL